ncbi:MAG TPA: hypothetical protein VGQ57_18330 [Polyangiaceae bacterium]|nr:hypothetical protein [Polyangiaceae bacterium]
MAVASPSALAAAEPSRAERAEHLFVQGRAFLHEGHYDEACDAFAESQRLDPASGTLLNLAACREAQGRIASAWLRYRDAVALGSSEGNADNENLARARVQELEPRVSHLTLIAPNTDVARLVVELDDARVDAPVWGTPLAADPGTHVVTVSATGYQPWTTLVRLAASEARDVRVPPLTLEPHVAPSTAPLVTPAPLAPVPAPPLETPTRNGTPTWALLTTGGVALTALVGTTYFGARAASAWETRNAHCPSGHCDAEAVAASDQAHTFARTADVFAVVSVLATVTTLYLAFRPSEKARPHPPVALIVTGNTVGFRAEQRF